MEQAVHAALATVIDPELRRPITELGMVDAVEVSDGGRVRIAVLLTIAGCPLRGTITADCEAALAAVPGVTGVDVELKVMTQEQRDALKEQLRGAGGQRGIPFNDPGSLTKVYAVASGKGGVGKSSVTVNLACALAAQGLRVGIVDADVYGFSVPALMGITQAPTRVDDMILPPVAYGVKVISIGMFVTGNQPVAWRGPMLHRALEQFLTDVYFGDLDALFLDLPPGTGDIAISVAQLLPKAQILVVTTPQAAAADVAERAGAIATQTGQSVAGVVENMSYLEMPDGGRMELFGSGGGAVLAERLSATVGTDVPLLGQIPLDILLREGGDAGVPLVLGRPETAGGRGAAGHRREARRGPARAERECPWACSPARWLRSRRAPARRPASRSTTRAGRRSAAAAEAAATVAAAAGAPALTGLVSSSSSASLMIRRGSYCRGSYFFQSTSSMSMPTSSLICSRAPDAIRRTSLTMLASFWVYSGSLLGPITRRPMISRSKNSGPLIPSTVGRLPSQSELGRFGRDTRRMAPAEPPVTGPAAPESCPGRAPAGR